MMFWGVDITEKFVVEGLDPEHYADTSDFLNRMCCHGRWTSESLSASHAERVKDLFGSNHPEGSPYSMQNLRFDAAIGRLCAAELDRCCPWLNQLKAVLQGRDALNPLVQLVAWPYRQEEGVVDQRHQALLVGFWPVAFPLEVGASALSAEFVKEAAWLEWEDTN